MIFRTIILSAAFLLLAPAAVDAQEGCSICGNDLEVGNPDAIFVFPGQPAVPCGLLQTAGETGLIPLDQCPFLPSLIGDCECGPIAPPPTEAP